MTRFAGGQEGTRGSCAGCLSCWNGPAGTARRGSGAWDEQGRQIHEIAHVCWQFAGLGPQIEDTAQACWQVRMICDAYGLADRAAVVDAILWGQDRCWRGIEAGAAAGDPAMTRLHGSGAAQEVRQQHDWVARHRTELQAALR